MRETRGLEINAVEDVVLTEPAAMHALADPFRLALHDELRRHGPSTIEQLAPLLREAPNVIREHLEQLELAGLVDRRNETTWEDVGENLIEPFLTREAGEVPHEAAHVRLLSYFMPEGTPARSRRFHTALARTSHAEPLREADAVAAVAIDTAHEPYA
jgi:hypothetical protein